MKKKYVLVLLSALVLGVTACASAQKEETAVIENAAEPEAAGMEEPAAGTEEPTTEASKEETAEGDKKESVDTEETVEGDPITGIVEKYADNVIAVTDQGDEITYYFSTQGAQVVEGNVPIAVGDEVQITYQGLLGDEEHPGVAVKIVAASMYNTENAG